MSHKKLSIEELKRLMKKDSIVGAAISKRIRDFHKWLENNRDEFLKSESSGRCHVKIRGTR